MRSPLLVRLLLPLLLVGCITDPSPQPPVGDSFRELRNVVRGHTDGSFLTAYTSSDGVTWASGAMDLVVRRNPGSVEWTAEQFTAEGIVAGIAEDDDGAILAVAGSELLRREGDGSWSNLLIAPGAVLLDIWRVPGGDLLVGGSGGTIYRKVNGTWVPATVPVQVEIWGFAGESPTDLVAVGQNGTILESSDGGSTWIKVNSGTSATLFAVAADGAGRFVAAGSGGEILLRDGDAWERTPSPTTRTLFDVQAGAPRDFLLAGDHGVLISGNGLTWATVPIGGARENLRGITGPAGARVVAGWWGTILDESRGWGTVESGTRLYAVHVPPDGPAMVVGQGAAAFTRGSTGWEPMFMPAPSTLLDIEGPSASDRIVVGDSGTAMHFDGTTWRVEPTGVASSVRAVWYDGTRALAVGANGVALVREGGSWHQVSTGTTQFLRHVHGLAWNNLYVAGDSGTLLRWNGERFRQEAIAPTTRNLRGVWMWNPRDIYVVGDLGVILHFDGLSWTEVYTPTFNELRTVTGIGRTLYIAGDMLAYKFEDGEWSPLLTNHFLFWLGMGGDDELIAVGERGNIAEGMR